MRLLVVFLLMLIPVKSYAGACSLSQLSGKWMTMKSNSYYGTGSRCVINVASSGGTFSGTCYDRYKSASNTSGGTTEGPFTASNGKITQVSSINSCLKFSSVTILLNLLNTI